MKTFITCCVVVVSVMLCSSACVIVVKPYECMLVVEKANRMLKDAYTAKYVRDVVIGGKSEL